jgi:hypothetical protein
LRGRRSVARVPAGPVCAITGGGRRLEVGRGDLERAIANEAEIRLASWSRASRRWKSRPTFRRRNGLRRRPGPPDRARPASRRTGTAIRSCAATSTCRREADAPGDLGAVAPELPRDLRRLRHRDGLSISCRWPTSIAIDRPPSERLRMFRELRVPTRSRRACTTTAAWTLCAKVSSIPVRRIRSSVSAAAQVLLRRAVQGTPFVDRVDDGPAQREKNATDFRSSASPWKRRTPSSIR